MLIYISSYPRSGNSLIQNLIDTYFERPITGVEPKSKLIHTKNTNNWRYSGQPLPSDQAELQLLALNLSKEFFKKHNLTKWIVLYDLSVPPYTKNCHCLLPGCQSVLTPKNRQKLADDENYFFIKTHSIPHKTYFKNEYVIQIIRHPTLIFDSYLHHLNRNGKQATIDDVIIGKVPYGSWSEWHQKWEQVKSSLDGRFLRFRFEDVLSDTYKPCEQIKALIKLDYNSAKELTSFEDLHQQNPNYYRSGKTNALEKLYSPDQMHLIRELHSMTMEQFGYE